MTSFCAYCSASVDVFDWPGKKLVTVVAPAMDEFEELSIVSATRLDLLVQLLGSRSSQLVDLL